MKQKLTCLLICLIFISMLNAEEFDINTFSNPAKYGWYTPDLQMEARQKLKKERQFLKIYDSQKLSLLENVGKAALIPAWGQFSCQQYTKGQVFLGIQVILLGSSWYFYDQAMEHYDKYKTATQLDDIQQYYNDAMKPHRFSQAFLLLYGLVWAYSFYDVSLETEKYNSRLWQDIVDGKKTKIETRVSPFGIQIKF